MDEYRKRVYGLASGVEDDSEAKENAFKSSKKAHCMCDDKKTVSVHDQSLSLIESERPGNLPILLSMPTVSSDIQLLHSWNAGDCSENIYVKEDDPFTFHRRPVAKSTDCIRGKVGYSKGLHIWEVRWPLVERGTHAVVGVATLNAPIHCDGYQDLIGCDDESWGWDIVRCATLHGKKTTKMTYPRFGAIAGYDQNSNGQCTFDVPSTFFVVLDMDEGTLSYIANGRFLGIAFNNLKGRTVYPIISAVWGHCEVSLKYINGLKPQPKSLMHLSRAAIRRKVVEVGGTESLRHLDYLNYPRALKDYLNYRFQMDVSY